MDEEVFASLPDEMKAEVCAQYGPPTSEIAQELDPSSGLDPEALAALPPEMRREIIEQEAEERRRRSESMNEPRADPSRAEEMDNASFLASLAPELREEVLLSADESFLSSLNPSLQAEALLLRERLMNQSRERETQSNVRAEARQPSGQQPAGNPGSGPSGSSNNSNGRTAYREFKEEMKQRGYSKVENSRDGFSKVLAGSSRLTDKPHFVDSADVQRLLKLFFLVSPVRPQRLLQKLVFNLCAIPEVRGWGMMRGAKRRSCPCSNPCRS